MCSHRAHRCRPAEKHLSYRKHRTYRLPISV
nr:MAG TPA: hypothetical protein [Bacteriophage sp.]